MIIMNYIKYITSTIIFFLVTYSCTLDVTPPASIIDDTFWRNEKDATQYLNNIYNQLAPGPDLYGDAYSNDVYAQYIWESTAELFQQDQMNASNSSGWGFKGIASVNDFLANVDKCQMDATIRERMKAEARAFRAIDYLSKTLTFGKVPIITTVLDPTITTLPRNSVEDVRKFIISELEDVITILPSSYNGGTPNEAGRITYFGALAYLSRACLYFGDFEKAEKYANLIMEKGQFSLFTISNLTPEQELEAKELENYIDFDALNIDRDTFFKGMFSYESLWHDQYANPSNPEYVFCRQYADNLGTTQTDWSRYLAVRPAQLGGWSSLNPTQHLVNAYWTVDGKKPSLEGVNNIGKNYEAIMKDYEKEKETSGISFSDFCKKINENGNIKNYDFIKSYRNRDTRLYASILFPFKGWFETEIGTNFYYQWIKNGNNESKVGYNFRKITPLKKSTAGGEESTADYPSFRYAEVLLIYAEARTHNSGYDSKVASALNQIRERAGMPTVPSNFSSKDDALELIRAERRIELAFEGRRNDDMTRYPNSYWMDMMNNIPLNNLNGEAIITMKWSERMRLKPLPQTAMDKNSALRDDQNPGY